jgi:hypothetical protein
MVCKAQIPLWIKRDLHNLCDTAIKLALPLYKIHIDQSFTILNSYPEGTQRHCMPFEDLI